MIELKDPILEKDYKLTYKDAFKKVSAFMESYSIKASDIHNGKIVKKIF